MSILVVVDRTKAYKVTISVTLTVCGIKTTMYDNIIIDFHYACVHNNNYLSQQYLNRANRKGQCFFLCTLIAIV